MKKSHQKSKKKASRILCSSCREAMLVRRRVDFDLGGLFDLNQVLVRNMPALVCPKCEAVSLEGGLMDRAALMIAMKILELTDIEPMEVRYLRKLLGDSQEDFAKRLGVSRVTANRWENGTAQVTGPEAYAIRSHAFFRLRERNADVDAVAPAFVAKPKSAPKKQRLHLTASELRAA